jgi:putative ABC transport system permease protein
MSPLGRFRAIDGFAVLLLAIGIGATTTMFCGVYAAMFRPLPFPDPGRLVLLFTTRTTPAEGRSVTRWSRPLISTLQASVTSYDRLASFTPTLVAISGGNADPEQIDGEIVSPGYFETLGIQPAHGRTLAPADDIAAGAPPIALISDRLWRTRYGTDPSMIGRAIRVNGVPLTVVGILPAGFTGLSDKAQVWIPRTMAPRLTYEGYLTTPQRFIGVVARLKSGVSLAQANAELAARAPAFADPDSPPGTAWGAIARPLGEARIDPVLRRSALLLLAAAACVLLITCANVAMLRFALGQSTRHEVAIRMALGASRGRIVGELLLQSLALAAVAGAGGTLLASWGTGLLARYAPVVLITGRTPMASFSTPDVDARALAFALAATLATTVLFGLAPALDVSRARLNDTLKQDMRSGGPRRRVLKVLVAAELAAATLLLAVTGLLLDSFARMQDLRRGFNPDRVLTFWVRPPVSRYPTLDGPPILERLLASIERLPEVDSAAVNRCTPFAGCSRTSVFFPGGPDDAERAPEVGRHYISADYFKALGIPLLAGRALTLEDRAGRPPVAVVNESGARRFWPGENPIGQRVWFGTTTGPFADPAHAVQIVGVVGDVKYESIDWPGAQDRPEFYTSYLQFSYSDSMFIVKTRGPSAAAVPALRRAVAAVDPALPIYDVMTLDERVGAALARPRFDTVLVTGLGAVALLLASLGVYGLLSFSVASRQHEIGVRVALGATPARVVRFIARDGMQLAALGIVAGCASALAAGRLLHGFVFDVSATDPRVLGLAALAMVVVAAAAAWLPARRAAAVDPVVVLRQP